jgi:Cu+-exporting ATPase
MLRDNDLCNYYQIDQQPGQNQRRGINNQQYAFLDDERVSRQLLDFADDRLAKVTLFVPGIHCSSCIWLLENLGRLSPAIAGSRVNFLRREVSISYLSQQISLRQVADLLASIGYGPYITLDNLDKQERGTSTETRQLLYKAGLAFFCFGNIMLLSLPEYLTFSDYIEDNFRSFFGYLNIILSLPVVFYCSSDYFLSAYSAFRQRQMNIDVPISLGIVALFLVSLYEILSDTGAGYLDSLGGLLFFLLSGRLFQQKTYEALSFERDYKSYFPISVSVKDNSGERYVQVSELQPGDRIVIRNQELIPADALLLKTDVPRGSGQEEIAMIDYSFVTGEAEPVARKPGEIIYAGGRQTGGNIELEVIKAFSQSYITQLWNNEAFHKENESRLARITDRFSKTFTTNVLIVSFGALFYWLFTDASVALKAFTSVLIIACPCAIALAAPFALGTALRLFGRARFYLKNTAVIEQMAAADTIIFDKTGTITNTKEAEVTFIPYGSALTDNERSLVLAMARQSTHPLSKALAGYLNNAEASVPVIDNFEEHTGRGLSAQFRQQNIRMGSAAFVEAPLESTAQVHISIGGVYRGAFRISNRFRLGLESTLSSLAQNYQLAMLSGDDEADRERLSLLFSTLPHAVSMHFRQTPQDKLNYVATQQSNGKRVMMLGDGLNDAGALKKSDIGVAVSEDIMAFSPASDAILDAAAFARLPDFIALSRSALLTIKLCFGLSLCYNVVGLSYAVTGQLSPLVSAILMPLSSVSVVALATLLVRWFGRHLFRS